MVIPWVALGLQALPGEVLLGTSNGASSHAQDRLLGSPRHTYSLLCLEVNLVLPCHVLREPLPRSAVWSLLFAHQPSSAEGTALTSTSPALVAASWEGFGGAGSVFQVFVPWCVPTGVLAGWHGALWCCSPFSWQQVRTLLGIWHGRVGGVGAALNPQYSFSIPWRKLQPQNSCLPHWGARAGQGNRDNRESMGAAAEKKRGLNLWDEYKDERDGLPPMETQTMAGN